MKYLALFVCAAALFVAGCQSESCHNQAGSCSAYKNTCGHQCCIDAKTDCAHCAKCSHK